MSDRMTTMSFEQLLCWVTQEHDSKKTVFGIHHPFVSKGNTTRTLFGRKLETVIGPAAGPHTQLSQNIVASYYGGSRFFELKTVQKIDGEDLPVSKPCIKADDEGYNVEWSTELYVPQAMSEYIKAWFVCSFMAKEYGLGDIDGFQFNMSVGYDLEGIKLPKIDNFIETLKDASTDSTFLECRNYLIDNIDSFKNFTIEDVEKISPYICNSVTLSTLHGCPPQEIERIANYLITEKGLNTFIKCNPTLLGYEYARKTMDEMGYDYVQFGEFHFQDDLQYSDAVPMLLRLQQLSDAKSLEFGVKITNTFPVDIKQNELPGNEMYMSGKSLYALSMSVALKLAKDFKGKLRISFSGGADYFNIKKITDSGIWPVTMATTLLKPGGYQRIKQIAEVLEDQSMIFDGVDANKIEAAIEAAKQDRRHIKSIKPLPSIKSVDKVPLVDCFFAPCKGGCPIHQDITKYMQLTDEGRYIEAMEVITDKNPLPFITGTICPHDCMTKCTRNCYDDAVHIRAMKLEAAIGGYDEFLKTVKPISHELNKKIAIIGGGPTGIASAYFLAREGADVTIFEKEASLGGVPKYVIPGFRITNQAIDKDVQLVVAMGVKIELNYTVDNIADIKSQGFDTVIVATGASKPGTLKIEDRYAINAIDFLKEFKSTDGHVSLGKDVVVIGGGNTAMDTARAAKKNTGVENVYLVYRRTKRYMPADAEELEMAIDDGVIFKELLSPVKISGSNLICNVMKLSDFDASGRRSVSETGDIVTIPADSIIAAVGEHIDTQFLITNKVEIDSHGLPKVNAMTNECSISGVYFAGDGLGGAATVVEGIRDAIIAATAITGKQITHDFDDSVEPSVVYDKCGILEPQKDSLDGERCLDCSTVCESCVEVCPNRANLSITVPGMKSHQILHVDYMCNECGNCMSFCPYDSAPYLDKFTLFACEKDFVDSKNQGFVVLDRTDLNCRIRYNGQTKDIKLTDTDASIPEDIMNIMSTVCRDYSYIL